MKSAKLVVVFSELVNDDQLALSKTCLSRGFEEINRKFPLNDAFVGLEDCNIHENISLDNCDIQIILNAEKENVVAAISDALKYENSLILYVGEVTNPFGQWMLRDGIFHGNSLGTMLNSDCKKEKKNCVLGTMLPCEDWQSLEKKYASMFSLCGYNLDGEAHPKDEAVPGLTRLIDGIHGLLHVVPITVDTVTDMATIAARNPAIFLFFDQGSAAVPTLVELDGFAMLLNCGYGRDPQSRRYLKYYKQIDVALLSHISYGNSRGLSSYSSSVSKGHSRVNHLFLPPCDLSTDSQSSLVQSNKFLVDLKAQLHGPLDELKTRGMQWSHLAIKGKNGTPLTASQMKPVQLFHKIGYGSLELIALSPFEEDSDVKKFCDDWKKSKYVNDSLVKSQPSSLSVLLLWRPFNGKGAVKRILYVASRSPVKKYLPAVSASLCSTYDFMKHADSVLSPPLQSSDGGVKKAGARKVAPVVVAQAKAPTKATENASTNISASTTKKPVANAEKTQRPATVSTTAAAAHTAKEPQPPKRSQTAGSKTKPEITKPIETKKPAVTNAANKPASATNKKPVPAATVTKKTDGKGQQSKEVNHDKVPKKKAEKSVVVNGNHHPVLSDGHSAVPNDVSHDEAHHSPNVKHEEGTKDSDNETDSTNVKLDSNKLVAVGTVECAITEHGEADFCDDTPEELSADQMREMGLYDDEEDDKDRPVGPSGSEPTSDPGMGNIAHLPMEGSFYGKDTVDVNDTTGRLDWNQPLALPMPTKDGGATNGKKVARCSTPIHVDCLCVPCDLDREDLRYLFECVRSRTVFLQLDRPGDLVRSLEMLLEEREKDGAGSADVTVIPSMADESFWVWSHENASRLTGCHVTVATDLTRCTITTGSLDGGGDHQNTCQGFKLEF